MQTICPKNTWLEINDFLISTTNFIADTTRLPPMVKSKYKPIFLGEDDIKQLG